MSEGNKSGATGAPAAAGRVNAIQAHPLELRERAYKLFTQRMPLAKIGEALDVPADTVRKWSSKGQWKARLAASGGRATPAGRPSDPSSMSNEDIDAQLAMLLTLSFAEKQQAYQDMMANESLRAALAIQSIPSAALVQNADKIKKLDEVNRRALRIEENKPAVVVNIALLSQPIGMAALRRRAEVVAAEPAALPRSSESVEKEVVFNEKLAGES